MNISDIKKTVTDALTIIFIAAAIALAVNIFHPSGFVFIGKKEAGSKIVYISGQEAKIKFDRKAAVFIDSRSGGEFREKRIDGAVNIPAGPESISNRKIKENLTLLKEPMELVVYCTSDSCGTSKELANKFFGLGYSRHVYIIKKGLPEWEKLGYPVKMGEILK